MLARRLVREEFVDAPGKIGKRFAVRRERAGRFERADRLQRSDVFADRIARRVVPHSDVRRDGVEHVVAGERPAGDRVDEAQVAG